MNLLRFEDIEKELDKGHLLTNATKESIKAASYDLRVGTIFRDGKIINEDHAEKNRQFLIRPGEIVSFFTLEELRLPNNIAGLAFAMNSWSSQGLLVLNPGHIDPGYAGPLTVKVLNLRKTTITISRETPIFTILFFDMGHHTTHPYVPKEGGLRAKESSFHAREQEIAPTSLADLLRFSEDLPLVETERMDAAIRKHWMSRWSFILALVAAAASVIAVVRSGPHEDFRQNGSQRGISNPAESAREAATPAKAAEKHPHGGTD